MWLIVWDKENSAPTGIFLNNKKCFSHDDIGSLIWLALIKFNIFVSFVYYDMCLRMPVIYSCSMTERQSVQRLCWWESNQGRSQIHDLQSKYNATSEAKEAPHFTTFCSASAPSTRNLWLGIPSPDDSSGSIKKVCCTAAESIEIYPILQSQFIRMSLLCRWIYIRGGIR